MKEWKRPDSILSNADVDALCLHFWEVFVLWDGAFSLAQTVSPMEQDKKTYLIYVLAAVHGNNALGCTVTPKDAQAHRVSNEIYSGGVGR